MQRWVMIKKYLFIALAGLFSLPAIGATVTLTGVKDGHLTCSWDSVRIASSKDVSAACRNDAPPTTGPGLVSTCRYKSVMVYPPVIVNGVNPGGAILISCYAEGEVEPPGPSNPTLSFGGMTSQVITFAEVSGIFVGGVVSLVASVANAETSAASGLAVIFESASPGVCSVSGTSATGKNAGTCYVTANQPGSPLFFAAPQQKINFEVSEVPEVP